MDEPSSPVAGKHYPATWSDFLKWFTDDAACGRYLEQLRWPQGFACPRCAVAAEPYRSTRGRLMCSACAHQASVSAGTIFDKTRTPLTVWFAAAWYVTSQKHGTSALGLQRTLGLGSYQTAWTLMHRFRRAMVRPNREPLHGKVEIDEVYVALGDREDTYEPNALAPQRKTDQLRVVIAAEVLPKGIGRIRVRRIGSFAREHIEPFVRENVAPDALIHTDGSQLYAFLAREGYRHERTIVQDLKRHRLGSLAAVNRVASLLKRWLLGTHHGAIQPRQLDHYLDEFVFRFNRRSSSSRGLLFYRLLTQACQSGPITYRHVVDGHDAESAKMADWS